MGAGREPSDGPRLLLARVAGLPAFWMDRFGGTEHLAPLRALEALEQDLAGARAALGGRLYEAAGTAPPLLRRFLLAVQRDCHNGRSLRHRQSAPDWDALRRRAGPEADRVVTLEAQARDLREIFERAYEEARLREISCLRALSRHPGLRRSLALASPSLLSNLPRLEADGWGRREERARLGLLRYVSRAALKLSPYSALTRVAMARLAEDDGPPALRFLAGPDEGREVSLVRLRRPLVQQLSALVLQSPAFRGSLPAGLNPTLAESRPGHHRLVRPARWEFPADGGPARFVPPALREVPVDGALVAWLRDRLPERAPLGEALGAALGNDGSDGARSLLDRLTELGLLVPMAPWSPHAPRLEEELASCLGALPAEAELSAVARPLARIVVLENGFSTAGDPAGVVREIEQRFAEAWRAALAAAGLAAGITPARGKKNEVFEDVVLLGAGSEPASGELLEVSASRLDEAVRSVEPWFRLVDLYAPRYEMLLTFAAAARRRWPGRSEAGALELLQEVRPWLREVRRVIESPASPAGEEPGFDPLELPEIAELRRLRRLIWNELPSLLEEDGPASRISAEGLQSLLQALPLHDAPAVGPCAFLQPAGGTGELWVLHRVFEGTGRYASRFTPALPEGVRGRFTAPLTAASAELLDLASAQGDTLDVHAVQTRRVLTLPGEPMTLEPGRQIDASTLRVRLDGPLPFLADAEGRPLLPVHLGGSALASAPSPLLFLALFGPGELRPIPVPRTVRRIGETRVFDRVLLGQVVLARRRWAVPAAGAAACFEGPPSRAFAALDRWRRSRDLPERVFAIERVLFEGVDREVFKPQYLDFTSPSFCGLFRAIVRKAGDTLTFEEMLPTPDAFPQDDRGVRWAVELQADALGWRRAG